MAKLIRFRASSRASLISTINLIAIALELIASKHSQAEAFPLLFNRPSIFRRTNQQQQAKQQQQQQQQQQQFANQPIELIPLANSQVPIINGAPVQSVNLQQYIQASQLRPAELMRLSSMHHIGAQPLHHLANNNGAGTSGVLSMGSNINANMDSAAQAAAYYKPNIVQPSSYSSTEQQQQNFDAIQPTSFDLYDNAQPDYLSKVQSMANGAPRSAQQQQLMQKSASSNVDSSGQGMHLEPTHTSEVVDKIEEHIGRQIEKSLDESDHQHQQHQQQHMHHQPSFRQAAASGYHEQAAAKSAEDKEAASSGEGGESSESSGGESGGESGHEEKAEKRHEHEHGHHEPKEVKEEHHHHHDEHPPEAFEVHHKKGGKSFQYFHQGHHH